MVIILKDLSFLKSEKIAHRGIFDNKRIYENTISAYDRALKYKYIIHIDALMLKDETIICFHDLDAKRLLHVEENIENMTYDELMYIAKYQIPTLEEALNVINGKVPIIIEIRNKKRHHLFEQKLSEILDNYSGLFAIQSFYLSVLKWFYKNKKDYATGYLVCKKNSRKDHFFKKYDYLNINILLYSDARIKRIRGSKIVIGYKILNKKEYETTKMLYDNLEFDNILEIDKYE